MSEISQSGNNGAHSGGDLKNPNYTPPLRQAVPLGIQHVLAMFAGNVTVPIIIAGVAGLAGGDKVFLIQMAMLVAGLATLLQTIGAGPIGARLPIMQGTSFAFLPVMIPIAAAVKGTDALAIIFGATIIGGLFHFFLGTFIGRFRGILPPLVTGLVVVTIGLSLLPIGVEYVGGGKFAKFVTKDFGAWYHLVLGCSVIVIILGVKFLTKGMASASAILIGLVSGYLIAVPMGMVNFSNVENAAWFSLPEPLKFGLKFETAAIIGMCLMALVSAIETVGDISGITKGGAGREATNKEITGGTLADGLGTAIGGLFGSMPNTSYSQNVGVISLTGVMSRHVVTIGAIFLIIAAFVPKVGAVISAMPYAVLGGGAVVMFGMIAGAGLSLLGDVKMNRRNMVIIAISLSVGLGLKAEPGVVGIFPEWAKMILTTGLFPVAFLSILLNVILPQED